MVKLKLITDVHSCFVALFCNKSRLHSFTGRRTHTGLQDSGGRTTGPGPDLNILILQGEIPSAAYCRHYQMTSIWNFLLLQGSTCASLQAQFSESGLSQLCGELRVDGVMDTNIDVTTGPRPLLILFISVL